MGVESTEVNMSLHDYKMSLKKVLRLCKVLSQKSCDAWLATLSGLKDRLEEDSGQCSQSSLEVVCLLSSLSRRYQLNLK